MTEQEQKLADQIFLQNYIEQTAPYRDATLALQQADGDRGDSCHKTFTEYCLLSFLGLVDSTKESLFFEHLNYFCVKPGRYVRHRIPTHKWWADPDNQTRDQDIPLTIAMGLYGAFEALSMKAVIHEKNKWFYWNKDRHIGGKPKKIKLADYAFPHHKNTYHRGLGTKKNYWFGDLFLILEVFFRILTGLFNKDEVSADLNLTLMLLQGLAFKRTPLVKIAWHLYKTCRPVTFGDKPPVQGAWRHYFRKSAGGPPLYLLTDRLLEKL